MKLLALIMTGGILASLLYTNLVEDRLNSLEDQVASANYRWLMTLRAVNTRLDELPRPVPPQVEKKTPLVRSKTQPPNVAPSPYHDIPSPYYYHDQEKLEKTLGNDLAPRIDLLEKKMDAVVDAIVQDQLEKALEQEMRRQLQNEPETEKGSKL